MTLRVGEEEVIFKLQEAMKHTLDHDDSPYFTDETDMIISDCVQEVLASNTLDEYLEELDHKEDKGEAHTPPTLKPPLTRKKTTPPKEKAQGKGQVASMKRVWSKVPEKKKKGIDLTLSPPKEVDKLFFNGQGKFSIFSCLSLNLPSGNSCFGKGSHSSPFDPP